MVCPRPYCTTQVGIQVKWNLWKTRIESKWTPHLFFLLQNVIVFRKHTKSKRFTFTAIHDLTDNWSNKEKREIIINLTHYTARFCRHNRLICVQTSSCNTDADSFGSLSNLFIRNFHEMSYTLGCIYDTQVIHYGFNVKHGHRQFCIFNLPRLHVALLHVELGAPKWNPLRHGGEHASEVHLTDQPKPPRCYTLSHCADWQYNKYY